MMRLLANVQLAVEATLFGVLSYSTLYVFFEMANPGLGEKILGYPMPVDGKWALGGVATSYALGLLFVSLNAHYEQNILWERLLRMAPYPFRSYRSVYTCFIMGFLGVFLWCCADLFDVVWIIGSVLVIVSYWMLWQLVFGDGE